MACAGTRGGGSESAATVEKAYAPNRLLELGRGYRRSGDATRAEQYLSAALESRAATPEVRQEALRELLATCIESQRFRVAVDYAEPELRRRPDDTNLMRLIATLYAAVGDGLKARETYERLLKMQARDADAELGLARVLRDAFADRAAASEHFERYLEIVPHGPHAVEARTYLSEAAP